MARRVTMSCLRDVLIFMTGWSPIVERSWYEPTYSVFNNAKSRWETGSTLKVEKDWDRRRRMGLSFLAPLFVPPLHFIRYNHQLSEGPAVHFLAHFSRKLDESVKMMHWEITTAFPFSPPNFSFSPVDSLFQKEEIQRDTLYTKHSLVSRLFVQTKEVNSKQGIDNRRWITTLLHTQVICLQGSVSELRNSFPIILFSQISSAVSSAVLRPVMSMMHSTSPLE